MDAEIGSVRDLIDDLALGRSHKTFLVSPESGRAFTFNDLQVEANEIARRFLRLGLSKGDKVALLMDNGLTAAKLVLGAMYGGFLPVPLNVGAGSTQLEYVLRHSDARVVFFSEDYAELIHSIAPKTEREIRTIVTDGDGAPQWGKADSAGESVLPGIENRDEALLMYTSGSTSEPKGVILTHGNILANATSTMNAHQLTAEDRLLCVLPLYHMNAQVTLFATLHSGGCVVLPKKFNVNSFWDWVSTCGCTWSSLVPTIISHLLNWTDPNAAGKGSGLEHVRFMRCSSAPLSPSQHHAFEEKFKIVLIEAMGSTEAGGKFFLNPLPPRQRKVGSPGIPHGFEAKILDPNGRELSTGQTGEIVIRGPSVMKGYYKNPQETAEALTPDGWLRTGDLGYQDEDGYFFVVGRVKELIIKGGENIAPREIDETLERHPAVLEAATVGVPDSYLGEDILAYVVLKPDQHCASKELLLLCERELGHFKTPTNIYFVRELPKGPSGKIQRLRLIDWAKEKRGTAGTEPNAESRRATSASDSVDKILGVLGAIWADVLERDRVNSEENFFDLGGDSLIGAKVLSRVREAFNVDLPLRTLFENPTVSRLALQIRQTYSEHSAVKADDDLLTILHDLESTSDEEAIHPVVNASK